VTEKPTTPKKPARAKKSQPSVLGSLPATRPTRMGRRAGAAPADEPVVAATAAKPKPAAAKAKPKPAAKRKPAAAAPKPKAKPKAPRRPTPPPPPPEPPRRRSTPPSGGELVTTAVQAAGELAQIGLGAGARVLRRAARRIGS
jgi:hypothetical protein